MATIQLDETLYAAFNSSTTRSRIHDYHKSDNEFGIHYLEIPITNDVFEIPVVAINTFINMALVGSDNADAISVALYALNGKARYATPDRNMRDILMADWKSNYLVYIPVSNEGNVIDYYGSHGMLLTKSHKLLVVLSWQIKRIQTLRLKYQFVKPILRIDPICFSGSDQMLKWCANKLFKTCLTEKVIFPHKDTMRRIFKFGNIQTMSPSILIEESPFNIRTPGVPDVLTTREDILQPVIDHIDELVQ